MDHVRKDYILLDDTQQIMVTPHGKEKKWHTYDEIDILRKELSPRLTRMMFEYNEMGHWIEKMRLPKEV